LVLLPKMGASCIEKPPIWTFEVTELEEETTGLVFAAIFNGELFKKDRDREEKAWNFSKFLKV